MWVVQLWAMAAYKQDTSFTYFNRFNVAKKRENIYFFIIDKR